MRSEPLPTIVDFERGEIECGSFNHEAHVCIAWLFTKRFEHSEAIVRFSTALRALTKKFGVPQKYHATLTRFWIDLIAERAAALPSSDWATFRRNNRDLLDDAKNLLHRYYSAELLATDDARHHYRPPDRCQHSAFSRTLPDGS